MRIPSFAEQLTITIKRNCESTIKNVGTSDSIYKDDTFSIDKGYLTLPVNAEEQLTLQITFDTRPVMMERPHNLKSVKCGSLVFSVPIKYEKKIYEYVSNDVERKYPYCDYEYVGLSDWNYGYVDDQFEIIRQEMSEIPFSSEHPPVVLNAKVQKINWGLEDGFENVCAKVPNSSKAIGEIEDVLLYPYGCAKLRMTELPMVTD